MRLSFIVCLLAAGAAVGYQDDNQGAIAGQVVNRATGAPLKDAIVKLRRIREGGLDETVRQTNEAGRFSFTGLWGRDWQLVAECHGFATAAYQASRYAPLGGFSMEKNQQIKDIVLKLVPQSVVTGRVYSTEGEPVEGAQVTLLRIGYTNGVPHWREVASATTLDNGEYRIPRVTAGHYVARCMVPRSAITRTPSESPAETGYAATYHPNVTDPSLAAPVDIVDGSEVRAVDVHLARTRVFHVRGRLQESTGWRYLSATLNLMDRADPTRVVATVKAGSPDFLFDIARIPPGSYMLHAQLDVGPELFIGSQAVDVAGQDVEGLALRIVQTEEIPAVVKLKSDDQKADLRKISIKMPIFQLGAIPASWGFAPRKIADNLTFRSGLSGVSGFTGFGVTVSDLPDGCYVASIRYGGRDVPESGIEYSQGASLVITIGADGGRVTGTVTGKDDQPVGRAVVGLFPSDGKGGVKSVQADAQGRFQFGGIPPGDYKLIAWDDVSRDDLENPEFVKRFESQAAGISLAASGSVAASLKVVSQ